MPIPSVTVSGILSPFLKFIQSLNASIPIFFRLLLKVSEPFIPTHPINALDPIWVTVEGIFRSPVNPKHPLKVASFITVSPSGRIRSPVKPLQFSNALFPIVSTEPDISSEP